MLSSTPHYDRFKIKNLSSLKGVLIVEEWSQNDNQVRESVNTSSLACQDFLLQLILNK
jgi:hypothetical protein